VSGAFTIVSPREVSPLTVNGGVPAFDNNTSDPLVDWLNNAGSSAGTPGSYFCYLGEVSRSATYGGHATQYLGDTGQVAVAQTAVFIDALQLFNLSTDAETRTETSSYGQAVGDVNPAGGWKVYGWTGYWSDNRLNAYDSTFGREGSYTNSGLDYDAPYFGMLSANLAANENFN
jgi:hypothetical protein